MKLPYDEQELIDIISQALRDEAPETNRRGWYAKCADDTGLGEEAIKTWIYAKNAPSTYKFLLLIAYLGPTFGNKIFAGTGYQLVPTGSDEIDAAQLKELLLETLEGFDSASALIQKAAELIRKQKLPRGRMSAPTKKPKAAA